MHVCFCCVCFSFSVLSQGIGWEECLQNDLFLCLVGRTTLTQQSVMVPSCDNKLAVSTHLAYVLHFHNILCQMLHTGSGTVMCCDSCVYLLFVCVFT